MIRRRFLLFSVGFCILYSPPSIAQTPFEVDVLKTERFSRSPSSAEEATRWGETTKRQWIRINLRYTNLADTPQRITFSPDSKIYYPYGNVSSCITGCGNVYVVEPGNSTIVDLDFSDLHSTASMVKLVLRLGRQIGKYDEARWEYDSLAFEDIPVPE